MTALLALALFGPAALVVAVRFAPTGVAARRWVAAASLGLAGLWLLLLLVDAGLRLGRFGVTAAGVGTWLLVATITWPMRTLPAALVVSAAALASGGASLLAGGGDATDAAGGLALAAAAVGAGVAGTEDTVLVAGAAVVAAAAGWRARRTGVVLLPAAIALAGAGSTSEWGHVAVLGAAAAVLAARPAVALSLWAVAAATAGAAPVLLGGTAVVVAASLHPLGALTAVPGIAALVALDASTRWQAVVVIAATVTALRLWRPADDAIPGPPSAATIAAGALGAWLLLAPETWSPGAGLEAWGTGVAIALVAGAIGAFLVASFLDAGFALPSLEVADPPYPVRDGRWAWRAAVGSGVLLAASGVALVASSLS